MKQETKDSLILTCLIVIVVMLSIVIIDKPVIIIEERNQSCELVDDGWTKRYKPIDNLSLESDKGVDGKEEEKNISFFFKLPSSGYTEDEIPEGYVKSIIYEKSCFSDGSNCVYYKREVYIKHNE